MVKKLKICIIGAESWGSAIATAVGVNAFNSAKIDNRVHVYVYDDLVSNNNLSDVINDTHENIKYLPGIHLPENLIAIDDLLEAARDADILIFSTPNHFVKSYCNILAGQIKSTVIAVSLVKGFEHIKNGEIDLFTNGISKQLGIPCYSFVTANSAMEMAQGKLCEVTIGCDNDEHSQLLREIFQTMNCKVVILPDVEGVELCGALKGVIALGAGFVDGLQLGYNARVAVIHLGLKEIMRFVKSFYPNTKLSTFFESCGVADLVASCYDDNNVTFAKAFVTSGKTLQELETSFAYNKELLGPQIVDQVYNFLSKSNKEYEYPLFTAIHKICQNEQHPETIIEAMRNHPDLHYPSIANLLNTEIITTRNHLEKPFYEVDDTDYLKSQKTDDLITAADQPIKSVYNIDDTDYMEMQNEDNVLKITADHPHSSENVYRMNDTDHKEPQNEKNFLEITAEEKQDQSVGSEFSYPQNIIVEFGDVPKFVGSRIKDIGGSGASNEPRQEDWMGDEKWTPDNKDNVLKITAEHEPPETVHELDNTYSESQNNNDLTKIISEYQPIKSVYKIDETDYTETQNKNNVLKITADHHSADTVSKMNDTDNKEPQSKKNFLEITPEEKQNQSVGSEFSYPENIIIQFTDVPKFRGSRINDIVDSGEHNDPTQEDWMADDEWRPHDIDIEYPSGDQTNKLNENPSKEDWMGDDEWRPDNFEVQKLEYQDDKLTSDNFTLTNQIDQSDSGGTFKVNPEKETVQILLDFTFGDNEENFSADKLFTKFAAMSSKDPKAHEKEPVNKKTVIYKSLNDYQKKNLLKPSKQAEIDEGSMGPYWHMDTESFTSSPDLTGDPLESNENYKTKPFEIASLNSDNENRYQSQMKNAFESQIGNPLEIQEPVMELKDNSQNKDIGPGIKFEIDDTIDESFFDASQAYVDEFQYENIDENPKMEIDNISSENKEKVQKLQKVENTTEFDEIYADLAAASSENEINDEVIPRLKMKKDEFALDFDSIIKELGLAALENERSRKETNVNMKDDLEKESIQQVAKLNINDSIAAEYNQILKEEHKIKSDMERSKQRTSDTNLNISSGINSAINSKEINKFDSGDNTNNEKLITWKDLFKNTEEEKTKHNAPNNRIEEESSFDAFKSSNEKEEMDKILKEAYDDQLNKHEKSDWNWIQLSNEHEKTNETGNVIANKINETKNKSESKENSAQKDDPPNTLSEKSNKINTEIPENSLQLTTSEEEHHQQSNLQKSTSNEPSAETKSVNVKIVDLKKLDTDTKKETLGQQYDLESSIDSVYSFVEKIDKPEVSKTLETWETLAENKKTEKSKKTEESKDSESLKELKKSKNSKPLKPAFKTAEKFKAAVVQSNLLDSKAKIQDQQKVNETKPESFITTKLKYLMDNKFSGKNKPPYDPNMLPLDTSVQKIQPKKQQGKKYVLRTPFHPPLNPRVKIPGPPFDGREHEYHTIAYRMPRPVLCKHNNLRRIQTNGTRSDVIGKIPPVYRAKSLFSLMRANKLLCAFQAAMFAAIFSKHGKL